MGGRIPRQNTRVLLRLNLNANPYITGTRLKLFICWIAIPGKVWVLLDRGLAACRHEPSPDVTKCYYWNHNTNANGVSFWGEKGACFTVGSGSPPPDEWTHP